MTYHTTALLRNSCGPMADGPFRDPNGPSYPHPKYWTHRWRIDINIECRNGTSTFGPQLFGSSAVVWYVMCLDSLNWALWVRFHGRYWYRSFIDGSNIWAVDRTDPWGYEMDHPPLGRSYLVVVSLYDMSCAMIFLKWLYGYDSIADIDINPSSMGPIFGVWMGPNLGVPKWTIRHWSEGIW